VDDDPPRIWRSAIADAAADLAVIDLPVPAEPSTRSVQEDWTTGTTPERDRGRATTARGEYCALLASDRG
jgi:hypothetical protein